MKLKIRYQELIAATLALLAVALWLVLSAHGQDRVARRPLYSSSFVPTSIASIVYGFEADSGAYNDAGTTLATDTQTVQQWNDKSSGAHNVSQATSGSRPTYRATGGPNSLPALEFDGTNSFLEIGTSTIGLNAHHTLFAVVYSDIVTGTSRIGSDNGYIWGRQAQKMRFTTRFVADYDSTANQINATTWYILAYRFDSSFDVEIFKNGSSIEVIAGSAESSGLNHTYIGNVAGGEYWDGKIAAYYLFDEVLSSTNMTNMWTYLNTKYVVY